MSGTKNLRIMHDDLSWEAESTQSFISLLQDNADCCVLSRREHAFNPGSHTKKQPRGITIFGQ